MYSMQLVTITHLCLRCVADVGGQCYKVTDACYNVTQLDKNISITH